MPSWPLNQWYVAAYSEEINEGLLGRTICNEPIVFYRTSKGEAVALAAEDSIRSVEAVTR